MAKPTSPLMILHLRNLFLSRFSSSVTAQFPLHPQHCLGRPLPAQLRHPFAFSNASGQLPSQAFSFSLPFRFFSSQTDEPSEDNPFVGELKNEEKNPFLDDSSDEGSIPQILSSEPLKNPDLESLSLQQRLDLSFSHISTAPSLILDTLNRSPDAGRTVLDLLKQVKLRPNVAVDDEVFSHFVNYFGRRKDFKAVHDVLVGGIGKTGSKSFESIVDRLVGAGRPTKVVALFERMEKEYGLVRNLDSLKLIVSKLCEHGFASYAEKMVKNLAVEFFPDEYICNTLIKGWCSDGKLEEAKRLAGEMYRGGFDIGTSAYNAILDCVCKLCRQNDPFLLQSEADIVLLQMEQMGVLRDVETFNVLIKNLCKIRKTEAAVNLFCRMEEWRCYPNETTFLVLIRSLYQAARVGEGDEMIYRMKAAGYGNALGKKEYYGFLKILCGIERIDHAMSVFAKMKEDGCKPGIKTYNLLMGKLVAHGLVDKANALYKLDPKFVKKKPTAVKKEKKRETLPEKMARKRSRLKKLRLSFVKRRKKMMHRAF